MQKLTSDNIRRGRSRAIDSASAANESHTTIGDQHLDDDGDDEHSFDEEEGRGCVVLSRFPSQSKNDDGENPERSVSVTNLCAICLEEYHEGETIVWSSNKNCPHAFHRDCLVSYLVKVKQKNSYPCPCCRQNFFFDEANDEYKKEATDETL